MRALPSFVRRDVGKNLGTAAPIMFRYITVALVCAAAWSLAQAASAEPSARAHARPVTLEEAVALALDASPGLRARGELIVGADAQVRQSGVLPNPTIQGELENFGGSGRFSDLDESELTLGLTQRLERGGKRESRVAVATAEREAALVEQERARLNVAFDARKAFVEVFAAQRALDHAGGRLKAAREIESMAVRRVTSARDPITVQLRAEIQTAEAKTAREQAEHDLHNAKRTLALLWGKPDAAFTIDMASLKQPPSEPKAEAPSSAPDVKAREVAARRASAKVDLEEANARPDVTVGFGVRRFENGGDLAGVLSLSVPLALFDTNQGNIDRAAAERRAAEFDVADAKQRYQTALVVLEEEVARSRAELDALRGALLPRARRALAAARRGFDAGAFGYQEIAEAQRILNELTTRETSALRTLHIAYASIDRLSGRSAPAASKEAAR
jgi:cobalt-zinc-cadmium efflux system outer membrane protein